MVTCPFKGTLGSSIFTMAYWVNQGISYRSPTGPFLDPNPRSELWGWGSGSELLTALRGADALFAGARALQQSVNN